MRHRTVLFILALLGLFGSGRVDDARSDAPAQGSEGRPGLPPIDLEAPARTATATFALG
jgi:hypothetical protein